MSDSSSAPGDTPPQPIPSEPERKRVPLTDGIKGRLMGDGAGALQLAGTLVFVLSILFSLVFFFITSINSGLMEDWARLRSMEVFAMLAAVGIVVSIISKSDNPFVMIFGILLIGALIVPTKDMVSLAMLASGQDAQVESDKRQYDDGAEFKGRITDLAAKIVSQLEQAPRKPGDADGDRVIRDLDSTGRQQAVRAVEVAINAERQLSHLERARLGGYLPILLSFEKENGFQEYYFRHSREADFVEDLVTLRRQELVTFSYSDFSEAEVTYLGKEIICNYVISTNRECPFEDVKKAIKKDDQDLNLGLGFAPEKDFQNAKKYCEDNLSEFESLDYPYTLEADVDVEQGWRLNKEGIPSDLAPENLVLEASLMGSGDQITYLVLFGVLGLDDGPKECVHMAEHDGGDFGFAELSTFPVQTEQEFGLEYDAWVLIARDRAHESSDDSASQNPDPMTLRLSAVVE